jgi:hypothetical protein
VDAASSQKDQKDKRVFFVSFAAPNAKEIGRPTGDGQSLI